MKDQNFLRELKENPQRNVAVVGLLNEIGELFLVRTIRFPDYWQPLGGGVDPSDKSIIDTLIREIKEEADLTLPSKAFNHEITTKYDFGDGEVHFFTILVDSHINIVVDKSQIIDYKWLSLEEAQNLQMFPATKNFINHLTKKKQIQFGDNSI